MFENFGVASNPPPLNSVADWIRPLIQAGRSVATVSGSGISDVGISELEIGMGGSFAVTLDYKHQGQASSFCALRTVRKGEGEGELQIASYFEDTAEFFSDFSEKSTGKLTGGGKNYSIDSSSMDEFVEVSSQSESFDSHHWNSNEWSVHLLVSDFSGFLKIAWEDISVISTLPWITRQE